MQKIGRNGKFVKAQPFDSEPDEFAHFITDRWLPSIESGSQGFHPRGYSLVSYLEKEAIAVLADLWPELPDRPIVDERPRSSVKATSRDQFSPMAPPKRPDTEEAAHERWRCAWVRQAQTTNQQAADHSPKQRSSMNILVTASRLRVAVEDGKAEKSAALAMLLAFQAIEGGYSLNVEADLMPFRMARGTRKKLPKTELYERFAEIHPGDNKKAVDELRLTIPTADDGASPFYWKDRMVIDRETGKFITLENMRSQLQKARDRMPKKTHRKAS